MLSFIQGIELEQEAKIITLFGVATMLGGIALMAISRYGK
jgi:hypothetical protein